MTEPGDHEADLAESRRREKAAVEKLRAQSLRTVQAEQALAAARAALGDTQARLQAIESSTAWRMTRMVIRLLGVVPPGARRRLRGVLAMARGLTAPHRDGARQRDQPRTGVAEAADGSPSRPLLGTGAAGRMARTGRPAQAAAGAPPRPAYLGFKPLDRPLDGATAAKNGRYALSDRPQPYVYVPLRAPDDLAQRIGRLGRRPRFSIITPIYETPAAPLDWMIASVKGQWYPHWELILVDDGSPSPRIRERLAEETGDNVRVILLEKNRGISGASNAALAAAGGDYVVFLDHDDELTPDCLYELALAIDRDDPDLVYSDEDKIDPDGRFVQPYFKPDWSPDSLMSLMYTCHVSCVRRTLAQAIGGLRSQFDGAQDWDFILRVVEQARGISHVPKVLYHWRIIPQSIAADINAKPLAADAGRRARLAALERRGTPGELEPEPRAPGQYRVRYEVRAEPLVSIVICARGHGERLRACVDSIVRRSTWTSYEIIVVDPEPRDPQSRPPGDDMSAYPGIRQVAHQQPFSPPAAMNLGAREARGNILVFLDDDIEVMSGDWLERLVGYAQLGHVGAVGAKLLDPAGRIRHAGMASLADGPAHAFLGTTRDEPGYFLRAVLEHNWSAVAGECLVIERTTFEAIGGFDETFPAAFDVELCFRLLKAGLYNVVCPGVELLQHPSARPGREAAGDAARLYDRHPEYFMADPFHNPNLRPNAYDVEGA